MTTTLTENEAFVFVIAKELRILATAAVPRPTAITKENFSSIYRARELSIEAFKAAVTPENILVILDALEAKK